jgi:cation:H+ antiporter
MTIGFTRLAGAIFLGGLAAYILSAYFSERNSAQPEAERHAAAGAAAPHGPKSVALDLVLGVAGLGLLIVGARFLVDGSISIASALGVSETVIGLTIVAVGTSLPELVTSYLAAMRGKGALALGNVIGSNIYNLLGILGATALVRPLTASPQILAFDNWVMLAATIAMIVFARSNGRIGRLEGGVLLLGYAVYIVSLVVAAN